MKDEINKLKRDLAEVKTTRKAQFEELPTTTKPEREETQTQTQKVHDTPTETKTTCCVIKTITLAIKNH